MAVLLFSLAISNQNSKLMQWCQSSNWSFLVLVISPTGAPRRMPQGTKAPLSHPPPPHLPPQAINTTTEKPMDMKNCAYWWFTAKYFGSKCHCKTSTIMAIPLALERQESYHHIRIITGKVPIQGLDRYFGVWIKVELRLSHSGERPIEQKLRNQWLLPSRSNCTCFWVTAL